jgi:hypothetical protein
MARYLLLAGESGLFIEAVNLLAYSVIGFDLKVAHGSMRLRLFPAHQVV